jgi:uncharacterized protein YdhG (YjbR/CyaY superfamily)
VAKTNFQSIDEYIASRPEAVQPALRKVRAAIRKALPKAEEAISYQIAAFKIDGRVVVFFAGWKDHYSIYPAIGGLVDEFRSELARYELSKGTIRLPLSEPVPAGLIGRLAKFRAAEVDARAVAKLTKTKPAKKKVRQKES